MLTYSVILNRAGEFSLTYLTAGLFVPSVVCDYRLRHRAEAEAARLNAEEIARHGAVLPRPPSSGTRD